MKRINISLSKNSIANAIKEVKDYKKDLQAKINELIDRMVSVGERYAINAVGHVDTGETLNSIVGYRKGKKGFVVARGNAVWLEFGTGVTYNGAAGSSPHPKGEELGMRIGMYGAGRGADPNGWYYIADDGVKKHTYGIEANMFMYHTARYIEEVFPDLAKEVFGND